MRISLCQISTNLINDPCRDDIASRYYRQIWEARRDEGYVKPTHFWELPNWAAVIKYNLPTAEFNVIEDPDEFIENSQHYDIICFSVLDANKKIVKYIVDRHPALSVLGGYVDFDYFRDCKNVQVYYSIPQFLHCLGTNYEAGYDYSDFAGEECIPRLVMSHGCKHHCAFCTESKPISEVPIEEIRQQIQSFNSLNFKLVYLNDKTFGQAYNHTMLPAIGSEIKRRNLEFDGFIIQTTTTQFQKLSNRFLKEANVRFVELGVETFNDSILRKYRKPSSTKRTIKATKRFRDLPIQLIPNIIIGMPEETLETYKNTLEYVREFQDVMSHLNPYNLSVYKEADISRWFETVENGDSNELTVHKSFHSDHAAHQWFHNAILEVGLNLLHKPIRSHASFQLGKSPVETLRG